MPHRTVVRQAEQILRRCIRSRPALNRFHSGQLCFNAGHLALVQAGARTVLLAGGEGCRAALSASIDEGKLAGCAGGHLVSAPVGAEASGWFSQSSWRKVQRAS